MTMKMIGETDVKKTNEELLEEYHEIAKMMKDLRENNRYREHEMFLPRRLELSEELIDWGFRRGQEVERRTGRGWEEDVILEVEGSKIHFRTMILPPEMIRRPEKNQSAVQVTATTEEYEQISLF